MAGWKHRGLSALLSQGGVTSLYLGVTEGLATFCLHGDKSDVVSVPVNGKDLCRGEGSSLRQGAKKGREILLWISATLTLPFHPLFLSPLPFLPAFVCSVVPFDSMLKKPFARIYNRICGSIALMGAIPLLPEARNASL